MKAVSTCLVLLIAARGAADPSWLPVVCEATKTVGLHDHLEAEGEQREAYEPVGFFPSQFRLRENKTFGALLEADDVALFVTMEIGETGLESEFECNPVRGTSNRQGFSCRNSPPSDILMIDPESMRFTRGSVGGWTFFSAEDTQNGASLFVEYGLCRPAMTTAPAGDGTREKPDASTGDG